MTAYLDVAVEDERNIQVPSDFPGCFHRPGAMDLALSIAGACRRCTDSPGAGYGGSAPVYPGESVPVNIDPPYMR